MAVWSRRGAWGLVLLVLGTWLAAGVLVAVGAAPATGGGEPLRPGPHDGGAGGPDSQVVLLGIPGLTWDVIDEEATPALAALAREGGSAALVLRGTHEVTCAADAWLTVGAGQRAATDVEECWDADAVASDGEPRSVPLEEVVRDGVVDPVTWDRWSRRAEARTLGPELGSLARLAEDGGTCVAAYGHHAVLGAAGPDGVARAAAPSGEAGLVLPFSDEVATEPSGCRVHLVGAPAVPASSAQVDDAVSDLRAALPEGTTLVVAGLGHTAGQAEATALVVHPAANGAGGALSSGSTRQEGLVQLTDLTPSLLRLAGVEPPSTTPTPLAGQPLTLEEHVDRADVGARDLASGVSLAKSSAPWVMAALAVVVLPVLVLVAVLRRGRLAAALVTVSMAVPVATFLAGLVPWWRSDTPVTVLTAAVGGFALGVALLAWAGPWRRDPLGPPAVVATLSLGVLGVDMMWSARLGLVSVLGLQPVTAGRFYGQGNVGFGIALGAFVVLAAAVLSWLRPAAEPVRPGRPDDAAQDGSAEHPRPEGRSPAAAAAVVALGGTFTVVGAAPWGGADFGGVVAVVVATGLLAMAALGLRWNLPGLLALGLLGLAVAAVVMVLDWTRGPQDRTHLGDFVQRVLDGEALEVVTRKLDQSIGILATYPLSWLAVLALVLVALVVARRPAWSAPLWRVGGVRPAFVAGLVAVGLAWVLNDSGIAVVALALTMMIAAALFVLGRELTPRSPAAARLPGADV